MAQHEAVEALTAAARLLDRYLLDHESATEQQKDEVCQTYLTLCRAIRDLARKEAPRA